MTASSGMSLSLERTTAATTCNKQQATASERKIKPKASFVYILIWMAMSNKQDKEILDTVNKANAKLASFFSNKDTSSNKNWDRLEQERKQWADKTPAKTPKQPLVSAPTDNPTTSGNQIADLEKLADLYKKGIITAEEFSMKKKQILGI